MSNNVNTLPAAVRLHAALALCPTKKDREVPAVLARALDLRATYANPPTPAEAAKAGFDRLVAAAPEDHDQVLAEAQADHARATFLADAATHSHRANVLARLVADAYREALTVAHDRLAPITAEAAARLTEAAPQLPTGAAALDPQAVLDAGAGDAHRVAHDALATLTTVAGAWHGAIDLPRNGSIPRKAAPVIALVALPETEPLRISWLDDNAKPRTTNEPTMTKQIKAVRNLADDATVDVRLALLEVARGQRDGCTLELAHPDALPERVRRMGDARQTLRTHDTARATSLLGAG